MLIEQYTELEFYKRYKMDRDLKCDEIDQEFRFERWIQQLQYEPVLKKYKPNPDDPRETWDTKPDK